MNACDGSHVENPDAAQIEAVLGRLSAKNWLASSNEEITYIRAGPGEWAATNRSWFAVKHSEGSPDRHFRVEVADPARVVQAFTAFAAGDDSWRDGLSRQRMKF